jgi:hypothetical protein
MSTYKVIQDIEAEDKLVGPLTLRQFIYAGVAAVCFYICFLSYTKGAAFMIGFFLPIGAVAGFFAFPWKGEQPTEIWALARIRFSIKPRVRIWDQDGAKNLVTITAPKVLKDLRPTKADLSQSEVRSRLKALADTIDSRGWATRNAAYGIYGQQWAHPTVAAPIPGSVAAAMPAAADMFDTSSTVSQNFDAMLNKSSEQQRQRVMQQMAQAQNPDANQLPQLPRPMMTAALPNIPTPNASSAYDVAPAPAPMPMQPQQPGQMPVMPAPQPQYTVPIPPYGQPPQYAQQPQQQYAQPGQPQVNNGYWFANGPAYPTNPTPMSAPMSQAPVAPVQAFQQSAEQAAPATLPAPVMPQGTPQSYANGGRIESDMPLATAATPTDDELAIGDTIRRKNDEAMTVNYNHMRVLQPAGDNPGGAAGNPYSMPDPAAIAQQPAPATPAPAEPVTRKPDPAILELANNDDLDIATIARQANREINKSPDEVEIRLH